MRQFTKTLIITFVASLAHVVPVLAQWTVEDMLRPVFDSSEVVHTVIDTLVGFPPNNTSFAPQIASPSNTINYTLDKSKIVGDIPYQLGTNAVGQVELTIPIETFASEYEYAPNIAIKYNSIGNLTYMGRNWCLSGGSRIEPVNKNYFTDGNSSGRNHVDGPWALDGNRLILQETTDSEEIFLSQTGNIKVVRYLNGNGCFRAFLPDGTVNDYVLSSGNYTIWYLTTSTALDGRVISFSYLSDNNVRLLESIEYGEGRSLNFVYGGTNSEKTDYIDGNSFVYRKKLAWIDVKYQDNILRRYVTTYRDNDITAPVAQVDMRDSLGNAVNPLQFHYKGDNSTNGSDVIRDKYMSAHYNFDSINDTPEKFIAFRGKLNYGTEDDAVIIYPIKRNYYIRHYHQVLNDYTDNDTLIINYNLNEYTSGFASLSMGSGFVSAFCSDVDGIHGEEFVKVNQSVQNDSDCVQFKVYQLHSNGLINIKTINRKFIALHRTSHRSIWPTLYLSGDFTGDGKDEVILCRTANPLNQVEASAEFMMIDLNQEETICSGNLDSFQIYIHNNRQSEAENDERARNSDRLFATDLDGDGKLEMCILTGSGLDIYRFSYNDSGTVNMTKSHSQSVTLSQAHDYVVSVGDVNGDGNTDLIFLPNVANRSVLSYISKGDGTFVEKSIGMQSDIKTKWMCFDYDQDGQTDLLNYYRPEYIDETINDHSTVFTLRNGSVSGTYSLERRSPSILVPMNIFGQSSNINVVSVKTGGQYDMFRCSNPKTMDALMTNLIDSRGCISNMEYQQLFYGEYYAPGYNAVFPFSTYAGGMFVCSSMIKRAGDLTENSKQFDYQNATIHKQGLGFCGFQGIVETDLIRNESTTRTFNPENFGVPISITSPREQSSYTFQTELSNDKRIKVQLTSVDKTDIVTGVETSSTYTYDSYGNLLSESTTSGGISKMSTNTYQNLDTGYNWIIGTELSHVESVTRDNQTITSGRTTRYNADWLPDTIITWHGNVQSPVSTEIVKYDSQKRPVRIKTRAYSGTERKCYIDYQGTSRIPKGFSDKEGMYYTLTYGGFGIIRSSVEPDLQIHSDDEDFPVTPIEPVGPLGGSDEPDGQVQSVVTGPDYPVLNRLTTTYHYDSMGRQDTVTSPVGSIKTLSYSWVDDDNDDALIMAESKETGHPTSRVWMDALGRNVRNAMLKFDGKWSSVYHEYDSYGRLVGESMPTQSSSPTQWTTHVYDTFDRPVETEFPDGHIDSYSYSGLSTTTTIDGVTTTRTVDEAGYLVEVDDGGGRIEYTLRPDGKPSEIRVGGTSTTFEYDQYGRRTSIIDPSAGCRTTTYDNDGNVLCETDARGMSVTNAYNGKGLLTSRTSSDGWSVAFTYDQWNAPTAMTSSNGHSKTWTYDQKRRMATENIDGFKKTFSYTGNQLSSVAYSKNNSYICSEHYNRTNGSLTSVTMNTGDTIWTMRKQNSRLLPTKVGSGKLETSLSYDLRGNVTERQTVHNASNATKQHLAYTYSPANGNMTSRYDWLTGLNESFGYDNLNRLTDISIYDREWNCLGETETLYDGKGNILSCTDAGQYDYSASLPYGMNGLTSPGASIPMRDQYLHFNAMQLPDTISENGCTATFSYYGDLTRAAMTVTGPDGYQFGCSYYDQQYNEFSKTVDNATSSKSVLWLGGTPYSAPAALLKDYGQTSWKLVHVLRDNLGSITHVIDTTGTVLQELAYTAWGQLRDPQTAAFYAPDSQPELLLGRGYTGHEHLPWFGLINMNARLYDPAVGRFLSPDPIILAPDDTQNFNRYSYCLNNPLRYVDPFGLWILSFSESGQLDMVYLNEIVASGQRKNASMNISFMDGFVSMGGVAPYASLTWQYHVNNNQFIGNGYEDPFVGGGGRGGGVTEQLSNSPIDWSQYYLPASPSSPQPFWQSLIIGAGRLNEHLGIANGYIKYAFEHLSTEDKSKLVYDLSKEIESITGNKIRNYSKIYNKSIPAFFEKVGKRIGYAGFAFTAFDALLIEKKFCASHILDVAITGLGFIPVYGWVINGVYYGSNLIIEGITGKDIGDYLNGYIEDEFGINGGVIIRL